MKRIAEATIGFAMLAASAALYLAGLPVLNVVGAVGFVFVTPGVLATCVFAGTKRFGKTAPAWSLALNTISLILILLLLRNTVGIGPISFGMTWAVWSMALSVLAWRRGNLVGFLGRLAKHYGPGLLVGGAIMAAMAAALYPEQFGQCFYDDGTETLELARSLKEHFLPYWELESRDRLGTVVVNPFLINSYWTFATQIFIGENELATRLPYWIWWFCIFAVSYRMIDPAVGRWPAAAALGLNVSLIAVLFTFYVGYNPYMADLGNHGVPDALFTLFLLLGFDCLRHSDRWGFSLTMLLASLILYSGPVFIAAILAAAWVWQPIKRKEVFGWANACALLGISVLLFYLMWGWLEGSLPYWVETIDVEYLNDYLAPVPRFSSGLLFFGYFALGAGGLSVLGLIMAFGRDPWQRTVATGTLIYLAIALSSGFKNLHYFGPVMPIPLILLLAGGKKPKPLPGRFMAVLCGSLIVCIALAWPIKRQTFTLNRELGEVTTIAADSYLEALHLAKLQFEMRLTGALSWDCDQRTWVAYATLDPKVRQPSRFVLTAGDPPSEDYLLVTSQTLAEGEPPVKLYARDEAAVKWLREQSPLRPLDRYSYVFRPLADGIYSPHNNTLEDVRRLHWPGLREETP